MPTARRKIDFDQLRDILELYLVNQLQTILSRIRQDLSKVDAQIGV